jgi:hypothetical protein
MAKRKTTGDPATDKAVQEISQLVKEFCIKHLNAEYADLCEQLTQKLGRKRPSPLVSGKRESWACGIVRTIGWVNFLDDPTQKPHMKMTAIDKVFGVGESTGQGKSKLIRKTLRIGTMDPAWTLPSLIDENPNAWMVEVNGFVMDARMLSHELQEEAFRRGMIPHVPERPQQLKGSEEDG